MALASRDTMAPSGPDRGHVARTLAEGPEQVDLDGGARVQRMGTAGRVRGAGSSAQFRQAGNFGGRRLLGQAPA
jgi:hypothetical protein